MSPATVSPTTALSSSAVNTHWFSCCRMVSVGLQRSRHLPVFGNNVLSDLLWSCLVPYLDSLCMSPTERHLFRPDVWRHR